MHIGNWFAKLLTLFTLFIIPVNFRKATKDDIEQLKALGIKSWIQFKDDLTPSNWDELYRTLTSRDTYADLLAISDSVICENEDHQLIGMAFLVPNGNPTEIYDSQWCHLRFVSVDPDYRGQKLGEIITRKCIELALKNNERTIALHTSVLMQNAIHIYEKMGFSMFKELEPRLGVRYWLYTLELDKI